MKPRAYWLLSCCLVASSVHAYDVVTHSSISEYAASQSLLNDPSSGILPALCAGLTVDDHRCVLPSSSPFPNTLTPMRLLGYGAVREDDGNLSLNHFFDPQDEGRPLIYGFKLGAASPDWALEDQFESNAQGNSMADAKEAFYVALTGATATLRDRSLGATFEALGHVIHHIQDMAQPQHVRNDVHCDLEFSRWFSPFPAPSLCVITLAYRPSAYEAFTKTRGINVPLTGYGIADFGTFNAPRKLWENGGAGIAEFASNNFVSIGTNFYATHGQVVTDTRHPKPSAGPFVTSKRQITDPDLAGPQGPNQPLAGEIWFLGTPVKDEYRASTALNERTSTYSIFDAELRQEGLQSIYTLNRFNYAKANEFLLPRAAAYSTGLINYFFRGRIGIALPAQGVYGIVDHATTYAAGQGFGKIKLKLHNASPDGVKPSGEKVPQTMQGGTLIALAKYTLNSCYLPDLAGDFAVVIDSGQVVQPANCSINQYFAGEEQIAQSTAMLAVSLDKTPTEFTFDFSSQPIPINARDLRIQVVYTGPLGAEADGIAFGGRDISEPTHLMVYNNSDYYAVDGKFYTPQQIQSDPALKQRVGSVSVDPKPLSSVAMVVVPNKPLTGEATGVPVNGYVRVAVLADVDKPFSLSVLTRFEGGAYSSSTFGGIWASTIDLRGEPAYITPLGIYRGPRAHFVDVVFRANNTTPLLDGELLTMSTRTVADPGPTPIPLQF
jgi:hypothetical protein